MTPFCWKAQILTSISSARIPRMCSILAPVFVVVVLLKNMHVFARFMLWPDALLYVVRMSIIYLLCRSLDFMKHKDHLQRRGGLWSGTCIWFGSPPVRVVPLRLWCSGRAHLQQEWIGIERADHHVEYLVSVWIVLFSSHSQPHCISPLWHILWSMLSIDCDVHWIFSFTRDNSPQISYPYYHFLSWWFLSSLHFLVVSSLILSDLLRQLKTHSNTANLIHTSPTRLFGDHHSPNAAHEYDL